MSKENDLHGKFNEMVDAVLKPPPKEEKEHAQKTRAEGSPARKTNRKRRRRVSR